MTDPKYIEFVEKNMEACYYDMADRMELLPDIAKLLEKFDSNGHAKKNEGIEIIRQNKIEVLKSKNRELESENQYLIQKLNSYDFKYKSQIDIPGKISLSSIQRIVENYYNNVDLTLLSRKREIITARQTAMYFACHLTKYSLREIGAVYGGKDHATVLASKRKIEALYDSEKKTRIDIENLKYIFDQVNTPENFNDEINKIWSY